MKRDKCYFVVVVLLITLLLVSGCGLLEGSKSQSNSDDGGSKGTVRIGYVQWASAEASTYIIKEVLENEGYDVKLSILQAGAMFQGLVQQDIDAIVCAWLPNTHKAYWNKYSDKLVDLGVNFNKAKIGLVVPKYVKAEMIDDLKDYAKEFNSKIVGIDPGAGVVQVTENEVMKEYGLKEWNLLKSSGPAMTASLKKAIDKKEAIVVTGWTPHWKWAAFDLKYLKDPKNIYGESESIKSLGRIGIKEDMPKVMNIIKNYQITTEELGSVMLKIQGGKEPEIAAEEFVKNNPEVVNSWVGRD